MNCALRRNGRRGIGIELKPAYFDQAKLNLLDALTSRDISEQADLFSSIDEVEDVAA